jgi:predicted transcriptional regulator
MIKIWKEEEDKKKLLVLEDLARRIRDAGEKLPDESTDMKQLVSMVKELNEKIDELRGMLDPKLRSSALELKKEEEILSLLNKHKALTSSQLSELIGLSRTRCNEYLKKLERKGLTECIAIGRKKVYRIVDGILNKSNEKMV